MGGSAARGAAVQTKTDDVKRERWTSRCDRSNRTGTLPISQ